MKKEQDGRSRIILRCVITFLLLLVTIALICVLIWRAKNYSGATIVEMLFHLKVPLEGTNTSDFTPLFVYIPISVGGAALLTWLLYMAFGRKKYEEKGRILFKDRIQRLKSEGYKVSALEAEYEGRDLSKDEKAQVKAERKENRAKRKAERKVKREAWKAARPERKAKRRAFIKKWTGKIHDKLLAIFGNMRLLPAIAAALMVVVMVVGLVSINAFEYVLNIFRAPNTIYEEYYVDPETTALNFTDPDRNLIWILCESMEVTYQGEDTGGAQPVDYVPELSAIQEDSNNVTFRDEEGRAGAKPMSYTDWTIGAIVAQTSGINLQISDSSSTNSYGKTDEFLPGDYTLGDILEARGYNQEFMCGSDVNFGGRDTYFITHGNYQLFDYYSAISTQEIPYSYYVFWGFEDYKLFQYAKQEITDLASQDAPFNFIVLTVDTHYPRGWTDRNSLDNFTDNYLNAVNTSSYEINEFLEWCKTQDWYENTTIVISGDHLSMGGTYISELDKDYDRRTYLTIINSATEQDTSIRHSISTFDIFPTVLAAMGVEIEGDRLGLGVNLFSDEDTLLDIYGYDKLRSIMDRQSKVYNDWFF